MSLKIEKKDVEIVMPKNELILEQQDQEKGSSSWFSQIIQVPRTLFGKIFGYSDTAYDNHEITSNPQKSIDLCSSALVVKKNHIALPSWSRSDLFNTISRAESADREISNEVKQVEDSIVRMSLSFADKRGPIRVYALVAMSDMNNRLKELNDNAKTCLQTLLDLQQRIFLDNSGKKLPAHILAFDDLCHLFTLKTALLTQNKKLPPKLLDRFSAVTKEQPEIWESYTRALDLYVKIKDEREANLYLHRTISELITPGDYFEAHA